MSKKDTVSVVGKYTNYEEDKTLNLATEAALVLGTKEVAVEQTTKTPYNSSVKLQSLRDANISYTGQVTKRQYLWNGAGSIQVVDALDAPYLLEKHIQSQSCCGVNDTAIFQQVD